LKRLLHTYGRRGLIAALLIVAASSGSAWALASAGSNPRHASTQTASSGANIRAVAASQTPEDLFAVFRQPATAADEALAQNSSVQSFFARHPDTGAQLSSTRVVYQDSNVTLGIFSTTRAGAPEPGVCLIAVTTHGIVTAPAPVSEAGEQPLVIRYTGAAGEEDLYGVVPDGMHSVSVTVEGGDTTEVALGSGGGFVFTSHAPISGWSFVDANGAQHHHAVVSTSSWSTMGNP
jgi:hypothetical protein